MGGLAWFPLRAAVVVTVAVGAWLVTAVALPPPPAPAGSPVVVDG